MTQETEATEPHAQAPIASSKQASRVTCGGNPKASDRPHSASSLRVIDGKGKEELPISAAIMAFEPHASEEKIDDMCDLCVLCWESPAVFAFQPCGHLCVCEGCKGSSFAGSGGGSSGAGGHSARQADICPMCRSKISGAFRVFRC
jgi:hypothetical protein